MGYYEVLKKRYKNKKPSIMITTIGNYSVQTFRHDGAWKSFIFLDRKIGKNKDEPIVFVAETEEQAKRNHERLVKEFKQHGARGLALKSGEGNRL